MKKGQSSERSEAPFLFPLPKVTDKPPVRRNQLAEFHRRSPAYLASDFCYNAIEAVVKALRGNLTLSVRRQKELGVSSAAEFVWLKRNAFRSLKHRYGVKCVRDLLDSYGKTRGCWQFHHKKPPSEVDPEDRDSLLACCHVSNVEPVTWLENMRARYDGKVRDQFEELPGLWN